MEEEKKGITSPGGTSVSSNSTGGVPGTASNASNGGTSAGTSTATAQFLEKNRKLIIEEFVSYFGEAYRDKITQKISDVTFICVPPKIVSLTERDVNNIGNWFDSQEEVNEELKDYTLNNLNEVLNAVEEAYQLIAKEKEYIDDFFEKNDIDTDAPVFKYIYEGKERKPNFKLWYKKLLSIGKDNLNSEYAKNLLKCMGVLYYRTDAIEVEELLKDEKFMNFSFNPEMIELLKQNENDLKNIIKNTGFYKDSAVLIDGLQTGGAEKKNIENTLFNYYFSGGLSGQTIASTCHYLDEIDGRMKSVIISPIQNENLDVDLIHELIHVLGVELVEKKTDGYIAKYGACEVTVDNTSNEIKTIDRNESEIPLDESVVDLTAEEIAVRMHRKGLCIASFNGRMTDGYEVVGYIRELFRQNKQLLQSTIVSENPNSIENIIGKDNYEYLLKYVEYADKFVKMTFNEREKSRSDFPDLDEMEEEVLKILRQFKEVPIDPGKNKG